MNLLVRAAKAARMVFGGGGKVPVRWTGGFSRDGWGESLPGTGMNWAGRAGDLWLHETVAVCLGWIERNLGQAELQVLERTAAGKEEPLDNHPLLDLLRDPNPYHDGDDLAAACALSWFCDGNAYLLKLRAAGGAPVELYWLPHWQVEPVGTATELITHYLYRVDNTEHRYEREDMLHFRNGLNPRDPKRGQAEATSLVRSIVGDTEWANAIASLAVNLGMPPVVLSPDSPDVDWDSDQASRIKAQYMRETTGDNRGKPIVVGTALKLQRPGLTPKEMDVTTQRQWLQDSTCAVFGLSSMLLGLTAGANAKTYANMKEAREGGFEECLSPFLRKLARCLERQLLPDFDGERSDLRLRYDTSKVPALQEDRDALFTRTLAAWEKRAIDRAETRAALGFEVRPEDEGALFGDDTAAREAEQQERAAQLAGDAERRQQARVEELRETALPALPGKSFWDWEPEPDRGNGTIPQR